MEIAITLNPNTGKIITIPIGQTIDTSLTEGYETLAVVPKNKVDFAIGVIISFLSIRKILPAAYTFILTRSAIQPMLDSCLEYYDLNITHIKNTDL